MRQFAKLEHPKSNGTYQHMGSAWLIGEFYAFTAWHCIKDVLDPAALGLVFQSDVNRYLVKSILFKCTDQDFAVLELNTAPPHEVLTLRRNQRLTNSQLVLVYGYSESGAGEQHLPFSVTMPHYIASGNKQRHKLSADVGMSDVKALHGLSGGPVLCGGEVVAINISRGDIALQDLVLPISELVNYPEMIRLCPALKNIAPSGFDLSVYARDGQIWWQGEHPPSEASKFWNIPLQPQYIDLDGTYEDFGLMWPQLNRLANGITAGQRKNLPTPPAWTHGKSDCAIELSKTLAESLDAASLIARVNRLVSETLSRSPLLWGGVVAKCPTLNPRTIEHALIDNAQRSKFVRKLIKYDPTVGSTELFDQLNAMQATKDEERDALLFLLLLQVAGLPLVPFGDLGPGNLKHDKIDALITTEHLFGLTDRIALLDFAESNKISILIVPSLDDFIPMRDMRNEDSSDLMTTQPPLQIVRKPELVDHLRNGSFIADMQQSYRMWQDRNSAMPNRDATDV